MVQLDPYLNFLDSTREVMEFYRSVLGGELVVNTFADFHADVDPGDSDRIMHSQLTTELGMVIMASDTPSHLEYPPQTGTISLSITGSAHEEAAVRSYWDGLAQGATAITMELGDAPWGGTFGMLTDRYGVNWLFSVNP